MPKLKPDYELLQSIYDISDEFYELFLGPTMGYTCGYYKEDSYTCSEAQNAKFDLAQGKLGLEPGMTLVDIGCGWGGGMQRALENYDINVIGLTLSKTQKAAAEARLAKVKPHGKHGNWEVRLQGWEEFEDKVDRIVSIGAFEHFRHEKYPAFFEMAYDALPDDGVMLLHTICAYHPDDCVRLGIPLTFELARFIKFIMTEIFPGGQLPSEKLVHELAPKAGWKITRTHSLQPHYARTLADWAEALQAHKEEAIALQGQEAYERFDKYLTGCRDLFRDKKLDVNQFTMEK
ncbi:methyltransferase domain-containing protein [Mycolicibacterium moriokaense]|nr:methyltransferase domain-containing protein [Mycolicibacterium moriokaense]